MDISIRILKQEQERLKTDKESLEWYIKFPEESRKHKQWTHEEYDSYIVQIKEQINELNTLIDQLTESIRILKGEK